jgi:hypothetical protein
VGSQLFPFRRRRLPLNHKKTIEEKKDINIYSNNMVWKKAKPPNGPDRPSHDRQAVVVL